MRRPRVSRDGRRSRLELGAAAVEFALVSLPVIVLITGVIEFSQARVVKSGVENTANVAARRFAEPNNDATPAQIQSAISSEVQSSVPGGYTSISVEYSVNGGPPSSTARCPAAVSVPADKVKVTVTATYPTLTKMVLNNYTVVGAASAVCN